MCMTGLLANCVYCAGWKLAVPHQPVCLGKFGKFNLPELRQGLIATDGKHQSRMWQGMAVPTWTLWHQSIIRTNER